MYSWTDKLMDRETHDHIDKLTDENKERQTDRWIK